MFSSPQADAPDGDGDGGDSSESDMESEPTVEREGERVTMETIHDWVQSATGKVSKQYTINKLSLPVHVCGESCAESNGELVDCAISLTMLTMSC
jgi:hypothetical protein